MHAHSNTRMHARMHVLVVCAQVMDVGDKKLAIKHIPGPEGVRGRNSDSKAILEKIGWEPTVTLKDGLR